MDSISTIDKNSTDKNSTDKNSTSDFYTNHIKYIEALGLSSTQILDKKSQIEFLVGRMKVIINKPKDRGAYMLILSELVKKIVSKDIRIVLIRGVMFSGKTTFAKFLQQALQIIQDREVTVIETDQYMWQHIHGFINGFEMFNKIAFEAAQARCHKLTRECINRGGIVIVSDMNLYLNCIKSYYAIAYTCLKDHDRSEQNSNTNHWLNIVKLNEYAFSRVLIVEPPTVWRHNIDALMNLKTRDIPIEILRNQIVQLRKLPTDEKLIALLRKTF
jgi:hypothetical protein